MAPYEDLLEAVGPFGPYQICMVIWFALNVMTLGGQLGFMAFGSLKPDVNLTSPDFPDNITDWSHTSGFYSLVSDYQLVGNLKFVPRLMITSQVIGMLVGSLTVGVLSDRWGRKGTYLFVLIVLTISNIGSVFTNSWQAYCFVRAFIGFGSSGTATVLHVWCMEKLVSRWRLIINVGGWPLGYMFCSVLAKYLYHWKDLTWALMGPIPLLAFGWVLVQESPKWLMETGRIVRLRKVFGRIARTNRRNMADMEVLLNEVAALENQKAKARANYTMINLFYNRRATITTIGMGTVWFAVSFIFYGNIYDVGDISGNPSLNMIYIMTMRAIIGSSIPLIDYAIPKLGRKHLLNLGFFCFGSCLVIIISTFLANAQEAHPLLIRIPFLIAMGTSSFLWSMVTVLNIESFPTVLRTTGFSFTTICTRVAASICPQVSLLGVYFQALPYIIFLVFAILGILSTSFLVTETKNKPLPDLPRESRRTPERPLLQANGCTPDQQTTI